MNFTNVEFAFFLPLAMVLYWLVPGRRAVQNGVLLLLCYLFYASWNPRLLPLLIAATLVDYWAGLYIDRHRDDARRRRLGLAVSLVYNIGQLCFFKYAGFFAESLNALLARFGLGAPLPVLQVVLPLGISFYTFQKLAYIIDVYDGRLQPCRSLLDFSVYVAFFPQIVAGPIVRGGELLPQLAAPRRLTVELVSAGAGIFLLGFVKKAYVAEYLGQFLVDPVFAEPGAYSRLGHLLALLGYGAQVFCDFSGYSEMAIGCGRLFGIELPVNFNYPYLSKNLIEFWRRWHITLNTWLFDYIYGPLTAGQGFMRGRLDLGFVVVFLLSGLWHGARWTFVLWGAIHAVALIATRRWDVYYRGLCRRDRRYVAIRKGGPYVAAAWLLTQVTFLLSLIPFRAATIEQAWAFARGLVVSTGSLVVPEKAPFLRGPNLLLCFGFVVGYHLLEVGRGRELREGVLGLPPLVRGIACGVLIALLFLLVPISTGTFIYALF